MASYKFEKTARIQEQNLKHNSVIDWQPMKFLQYWTNMVAFISLSVRQSVYFMSVRIATW